MEKIIGMNLDTVFNGIGTEIISIMVSLIIGAIGGGILGYKIGIKHSYCQKQISGAESEQEQEFRVDNMDIVNGSIIKNEKISQYQEAGTKSKQTQIAGVSTKQVINGFAEDDGK